MKLIEELADFFSRLELTDIPDQTVDLTASQVLYQLAAIRTGMRHEHGLQLIEAFGPPLQPDVQRSACVMGAAGSLLNLEDSSYSGHLSSSTVGVPLAYAYARRLSGADLLAAVAAANECAARLTAAAPLGPFPGQAVPHTHLVGAIAGRLHAERAPSRQWTNALGIALTMAPWALAHGILTSDARMLHAFNPIRSAMDACDAATAGLAGAPDILEYPGGFLDQFAMVPVPETITAGLGERWHTDTLSFKLHPGGPGSDAAVDCAIDLHDAVRARGADEITEVSLPASLYTALAHRTSAPYLNGSGTPMGALLLRTDYPVATALLTGRLTADDFLAPAVTERKRWALAAKVRLHHDPSMTRDLFASDARFGEAVRQAGHRADPWLRTVGGDDLIQLLDKPAPPRSSFANSAKRTPARVTVRFRDGGTLSRERHIPDGTSGSQLHACHSRLMRDKFMTTDGPADIADAVENLRDVGPAALRSLIRRGLFA